MCVFRVEDRDLKPALKEGKPWRGLLKYTIWSILSFLKNSIKGFFFFARKEKITSSF